MAARTVAVGEHVGEREIATQYRLVADDHARDALVPARDLDGGREIVERFGAA